MIRIITARRLAVLEEKQTLCDEQAALLNELCICEPDHGQPKIVLEDGWLLLPEGAVSRECAVHGEPLAVIDELRAGEA